MSRNENKLATEQDFEDATFEQEERERAVAKDFLRQAAADIRALRRSRDIKVKSVIEELDRQIAYQQDRVDQFLDLDVEGQREFLHKHFDQQGCRNSMYDTSYSIAEVNKAWVDACVSFDEAKAGRGK